MLLYCELQFQGLSLESSSLYTTNISHICICHLGLHREVVLANAVHSSPVLTENLDEQDLKVVTAATSGCIGSKQISMYSTQSKSVLLGSPRVSPYKSSRIPLFSLQFPTSLALLDIALLHTLLFLTLCDICISNLSTLTVISLCLGIAVQGHIVRHLKSRTSTINMMAYSRHREAGTCSYRRDTDSYRPSYRKDFPSAACHGPRPYNDSTHCRRTDEVRRYGRNVRDCRLQHHHPMSKTTTHSRPECAESRSHGRNDENRMSLRYSPEFRPATTLSRPTHSSQSRSPPSDAFRGVPVQGQILFLGHESTIPADCILRSNLKPEHGRPWSHPVMILTVNKARKLVSFVQLTSEDIVRKATNREWPMRYVPIKHHERPRSSGPTKLRNTDGSPQYMYINDRGQYLQHPDPHQPFLHLKNGKQMRDPSCVNVEQEHTIEWEYLANLRGAPDLFLTEDSVEVVRVMVRDHVPMRGRGRSSHRRDSVMVSPVPRATTTPSASRPPPAASVSPVQGDSSSSAAPAHKAYPTPPPTPEKAKANLAEAAAANGRYVPPHKRGRSS